MAPAGLSHLALQQQAETCTPLTSATAVELLADDEASSKCPG